MKNSPLENNPLYGIYVLPCPKQRLIDLAVLSIERHDLSSNEIVDKFAAEDENRK